ncbi:MAG: antibiotic ABC transporter ATP-binding protein [Candidatus Rokuibacteriota bacterium]|nr:MAG: antibiotic ABC transporter ATP-binding protein [Candidatus Rokubacteria bacterium]
MPDAHLEQDEVLGRAFDRRLAARLWVAARAHRPLLYATLALYPAIALAELSQPYLLKIAIDDHILAGDWIGLSLTAAVYAATLAVLYGLRMLEAYLMALVGQRVTHDLRNALFGHLLRLEAGFYDRNPVGRLMTRVLNDVEAVSEAFTSGLLAIAADVITLAGVVAVMLWMDWRLALVTFAIVPVLGAAAAYFRIRARDAYRQARRRLAALNAFLQESLQGVAVIQLFARERHEHAIFRRLNRDYRRAMFSSTIFEATLYASVEALGAVALALLIWYGGGQIGAGALSFGALVAFIQYTNRFFLPIRDLGAKYTVMQSAMASAERIFGLLERPPAIVSPADGNTADRADGATTLSLRPPTSLPDHAAPATIKSVPAIEFSSVSFSYTDDAFVLRDCSFRVAAGEHVALVGATGEGKSTCARLLIRAYDVTRGRVLVDGVDVREWDLARLRRRVGTVFQDTVLFAGTVADNVTLGAALPPGALARALDTARARDFVEALPRGVEEPLGERGANLSHGQRQLLAIARALVYNPAILVLDEATSSVDPESEWRIREAMQRLLAGRTSITIAHRLSTVQRADRILVLHRGRVHEEGTHAALVRGGGLYARLWELGLAAPDGTASNAAPAR